MVKCVVVRWKWNILVLWKAIWRKYYPHQTWNCYSHEREERTNKWFSPSSPYGGFTEWFRNQTSSFPPPPSCMKFKSMVCGIKSVLRLQLIRNGPVNELIIFDQIQSVSFFFVFSCRPIFRFGDKSAPTFLRALHLHLLTWWTFVGVPCKESTRALRLPSEIPWNVTDFSDNPKRGFGIHQSRGGVIVPSKFPSTNSYIGKTQIMRLVLPAILILPLSTFYGALSDSKFYDCNTILGVEKRLNINKVGGWLYKFHTLCILVHHTPSCTYEYFMSVLWFFGWSKIQFFPTVDPHSTLDGIPVLRRDSVIIRNSGDDDGKW